MKIFYKNIRINEINKINNNNNNKQNAGLAKSDKNQFFYLSFWGKRRGKIEMHNIYPCIE